jgi:hypothetical protein
MTHVGRAHDGYFKGESRSKRRTMDANNGNISICISLLALSIRTYMHLMRSLISRRRRSLVATRKGGSEESLDS